MIGYLDELDNIFISSAFYLRTASTVEKITDKQWDVPLSQVCHYRLYEPGKIV